MQTPSRAALTQLQREIDVALTASEQEYFDDVVRHKSAAFAKEITAKRLEARHLSRPSRTRAVCPPMKRWDNIKLREATQAVSVATPAPEKVLRRRFSCSMPSLPFTLASCAEPMAFETATSSIPHDTALSIDHLLTREVHARTHRAKMEQYIRKLEHENVAWRDKFKAEVAKTMDAAALRETHATTQSTIQELRDAVYAAEARSSELEAQVQALTATATELSINARDMAVQVLDETRLSNNEFEVRLVQEQITSSELREVVTQCMEKIADLTSNNLLLIEKEVEEIKAAEPPEGMSFRAKEAPPPFVRFKITTSIDYLDVVPWQQYARHFQTLVAGSDGVNCGIPALAVPTVFSAQFWSQQSTPAVHDRWLDQVTAFGVADSGLQRFDIDQVLGLIHDIWVDRAVYTLQTNTLRVPRQSFPTFVQHFFLRRYTTYAESKAQLYLFILGITEYRESHGRIHVMGCIMGLSNLRCFSPRMADSLLALLVGLIPLPTLAGTLTLHTHKPLQFGLNVVIMALNNVFPLLKDPNDVPNYVDRVVIGPETQASMREMLHDQDPDIADTPLGTARSVSSSRLTSRHLPRSKRWTMLTLEGVLGIAMHVWNTQAARDLEAITVKLKRDAPIDGIEYREFKALVAKYFTYEFVEQDVLEMYQKAYEFELNAEGVKYLPNVKLESLVRMLCAKGVPKPDARTKKGRH
ncbi:hypothetical protein SDRG_08398 [Saprolegnia diclina VS20]|uniref:Uncharacterized protein n=1 Tax=Saprolegnia diclina (strain VS20) TaxID=1156394 RepID=T0Q8H9_SAPDV|nr:hypothetical protein SDRG_08398 [Saprolegnia diclina VS20]EQC34194.1 hypothetical protein SDRG_08398 [Saprolegnia diclina VS20]|eukprot:XP_008612506.1 hypothetical protein SDRG_08398 [Saprolegnia diclina VS20]